MKDKLVRLIRNELERKNVYSSVHVIKKEDRYRANIFLTSKDNVKLSIATHFKNLEINFIEMETGESFNREVRCSNKNLALEVRDILASARAFTVLVPDNIVSEKMDLINKSIEESETIPKDLKETFRSGESRRMSRLYIYLVDLININNMKDEIEPTYKKLIFDKTLVDIIDWIEDSSIQEKEISKCQEILACQR